MYIEPLTYPANFLRHNSINALSLLFSHVNVLCPTEDEDLSPCSTQGMDGRLYINRLVTSPLGKRQKKFRRILDQMHTWGEQMGLDNKSVADSIHTEAFKPATESITSILTSMRKKKVQDPLLKTRLFLQIALENDMQDDLLEIEVKTLAKKQRNLTEIMGGTPHKTDPSISMAPERSPANTYGIKMLNMPSKRLKAWMKFANRYQDNPLQTWPVGESVAVKDIMDRAYEKATGRIAVDLMNVNMPGEAYAPDLKTKLRDGLSKLMDNIRDELERNDGSDIMENDLIKNICTRIEVSIDAKKIQKNPGPIFNLTLYPGIHMDDLFPMAAGLKKRKKPPRLFSSWCRGSFYLL